MGLDFLLRWFRKVDCISCTKLEREPFTMEYDGYALCRKCAQRILDRERKRVQEMKRALEPFACWGRPHRNADASTRQVIVVSRGEGFTLLTGDFVDAYHAVYGKPLGPITNRWGVEITDKTPLCPDCGIRMTGYDPELCDSGWYCERCGVEDTSDGNMGGF